MPRFRPSLWPTVFTVPTLIALIALGIWQIERLHWKEALIADRQARSEAPAIALPDPVSAPEALEYTPVRVTGRFLHERELYLAARTLDGAAGLHVVTPFALDDGRIVLVDRGWIPESHRDPATRPDGQVEGRITLTGLARTPGWKGWEMLRPENLPEQNVWFWVDPAAMTARAGLPEVVEAVYLDAGPAENPGGWPKGGQTRLALPNDHLEYAITWFALALALAVIYVVYHWRRDERRPEP